MTKLDVYQKLAALEAEKVRHIPQDSGKQLPARVLDVAKAGGQLVALKPFTWKGETPLRPGQPIEYDEHDFVRLGKVAEMRMVCPRDDWAQLAEDTSFTLYWQDKIDPAKSRLQTVKTDITKAQARRTVALSLLQSVDTELSDLSGQLAKAEAALDEILDAAPVV